MTDSDHTPSPTHCISCGTEVLYHAKVCHACGSAVYRPDSDEAQPLPVVPKEPMPLGLKLSLSIGVAMVATYLSPVIGWPVAVVLTLAVLRRIWSKRGWFFW
jgi:hypothetical protein